MNRIDLHMHSTYSDGTCTVKELILQSKTRGLEVISITDHDTVDQIKEAVAAGKEAGIKVIPGTELSCEYNGKGLHLLGYNINPDNVELKQAIEKQNKAREERISEMIEKLVSLGFLIDRNSIAAKDKGSIGRPFIADLVCSKEENLRKLDSLGIPKEDFFEKYLSKNGEAYSERSRIEFIEGINLIHKAGGVAVWAHPCWSMKNNAELIEQWMAEFKKAGLDGVETFYSTYSKDDTELIYLLTKKFNLFMTAGSDYHGPGKDIVPDVGIWNDFGFVWKSEYKH